MTVLPDWVRKYKTKGVEIRVSGQNYYAYEMSSRWNKEKKRADKITGKYLGVVTHDGIVKTRSMGLVRSDYEYGNIALLHGIAEKTVIPVLKDIYPTMWERIISYVILRNIQPLPMKSVHYLYEKTYLSRIMNESMSPDSLSRMLSSLPEDRSISVMRKLTEKGEYVLMDSTAIFSRSFLYTLNAYSTYSRCLYSLYILSGSSFRSERR